jgi:predicted phosphoribosyltransferase
MRAAVAAARRQEPDRPTVAVPVALPTACKRFATDVDGGLLVGADVVLRDRPGYEDLRATTDDVRKALA